jgi:hypothetical protein
LQRRVRQEKPEKREAAPRKEEAKKPEKEPYQGKKPGIA